MEKPEKHDLSRVMSFDINNVKEKNSKSNIVTHAKVSHHQIKIWMFNWENWPEKSGDIWRSKTMEQGDSKMRLSLQDFIYTLIWKVILKQPDHYSFTVLAFPWLFFCL